MGRPTEYKDEYADLAYKYCLLGATDKELATFFDVKDRTINNWKKSHPDFFQSIKRGREVADATVADRLFKRATGYEHPDVHISNYMGDITATDIIKHYPPDTTACIFWLKNRQKDKWRDKKDHEVMGADGGPIQFSDIERAKRLAALLDRARARRDGQPDRDE
jgi:hypothetical protein